MICSLKRGFLLPIRLAHQDAAALRRQINPDRCALPDVLGRRRDHAQLGAIGELHEVVPARSQKDLPDYCASEHVIHALGLALSQSCYVLAHRNGSFVAGNELPPGAAQLATGAGEVGFIERLSLDDVARSDETGHEFRPWAILDLFRRASLLD